MASYRGNSFTKKVSQKNQQPYTRPLTKRELTAEKELLKKILLPINPANYSYPQAPNRLLVKPSLLADDCCY